MEDAVLIRNLCRMWNMSRAEVLAAEPYSLLRDTVLVGMYDEGLASRGE